MKNILICGGTGLVGKRLTEILLTKGYTVSILSRNPKPNRDNIKYFKWNIEEEFIDENAFSCINSIINLAGTNVGDKRWTSKRKKEILDSRVNSTKLLLKYLKKLEINLDSYISSSAVGYYGTYTSEEIFNEDMPVGNDFLANVCQKWEEETIRLSSNASRTVILRTGVVLAKDGGALSKMIAPAKLGLNAPLGSGKQYVPWIHIDDLCNLYIYSIENDGMKSIYNAIASEHITNSKLTCAISKILNKPYFMPNLPKFFMNFLFGEMSVILLEGSRVSNQKVIDSHFVFEYNSIESALRDLLI